MAITSRAYITGQVLGTLVASHIADYTQAYHDIVLNLDNEESKQAFRVGILDTLSQNPSPIIQGSRRKCCEFLGYIFVKLISTSKWRTFYNLYKEIQTVRGQCDFIMGYFEGSLHVDVIVVTDSENE